MPMDDGVPCIASGAEWVARGMYYTGLNFGNTIEMFTKWHETHFFGTDDQSLSEKLADPRNDFNTYGVCDTIEQWREHYGKVYDDHQLPCVVSFTPIVRANQPPQDGWRWHKWGRYIGTHEPQCEYLYDEEGIEQVLVWSVSFLELS